LAKGSLVKVVKVTTPIAADLEIKFGFIRIIKKFLLNGCKTRRRRHNRNNDRQKLDLWKLKLIMEKKD